jgi:hypothetical protein
MAIAPELCLTEGLDPANCNLSDSAQTPGAEHWFGTDILGCDYYTRVVYGARTSLEVGLVVGCLTMAIAPTAQALPLEGRLSVSSSPFFYSPTFFAGSAELGLKGTPWSVGGLLQSNFGNASQMLSGWGSYSYPLSPDSAISVLLGGQHYWGITMRDATYYPNNIGVMAGVSYFHKWNRLWLRLTPWYTFFFQEAYVPIGTGLPWAEVGYNFGPVDISLGVSLTPLKASFAF